MNNIKRITTSDWKIFEISCHVFVLDSSKFVALLLYANLQFAVARQTADSNGNEHAEARADLLALLTRFQHAKGSATMELVDVVPQWGSSEHRRVYVCESKQRQRFEDCEFSVCLLCAAIRQYHRSFHYSPFCNDQLSLKRDLR